MRVRPPAEGPRLTLRCTRRRLRRGGARSNALSCKPHGTPGLYAPERRGIHYKGAGRGLVMRRRAFDFAASHKLTTPPPPPHTRAVPPVLHSTLTPPCCSVACLRRPPPLPAPEPPCPAPPPLVPVAAAPCPPPRLLPPRLLLFRLPSPSTLTVSWCVEARPFQGRDQCCNFWSSRKRIRMWPDASRLFSSRTEGGARRKRSPRRSATCFSRSCPTPFDLAR